MLTRLRRSRGYGKFRRNTWAVSALAIIAVYAAVAAFTLATEVLDAAGRATGAFSLRGVPVLGALLPERTSERVGPKWVPGFGLPAEASRRLDQADFVLERAGLALRNAERAAQTPGADAAAADRALEEFALAERRMAEVPLDQLRAWYDEARAAFAQLDAVKQRMAALDALWRQKASAAALLARLAAAPGDAALRDDAGRAIEEIAFQLEDYAKLPGAAGDAVASIDANTLVDAAEAVMATGAGTGEIAASASAGAARLESLAPAVRSARAALDEPLGTALAAVEPAVERLMPMPTGVEGFTYAARLSLGTDDQGRSILIRAIYSSKTAIQVGVVVAVAAVLVGALLGAAAAYLGGTVDHAVTWLYSTLSSLPQLVLLAVIAFMFLGSAYEKTLVPVYVALGLTFWIGPCRVIRGEVLKIRQLEYVQAGRAMGFPRGYILLRHVLPNTAHLMFIQFSLLFIGAVKSEVILTFLGLGVKEGASWGLMITQAAPEVVNGIFWQIGAATAFMLVLVLAFNVVSDALQDAFDPRHVG